MWGKTSVTKGHSWQQTQSSAKSKFHYANFVTKSAKTNHESPRHKSHRQISWFVSASWTLSPTFPVHCNRLNSIKATQTGMSQTLSRKHLTMSRWFVSTTSVICVHDVHRDFMISWSVTVTFMICVRDFPSGEVSVKVSVMEFGL